MTHPIPDAALDEDIAILGRKGGGKTFTAKGIVERLLDLGRRVLILDPLGVWPGLRTAADGEHPGYPVAIFGGQHSDLPLDTAAAAAMADVLARENVPAVIDLSDLSKAAQQSFLLKFLSELRRVNREALTLVLEEADVFAPQNPQGDDSKALHAEIDWIARRGRFRGFRLITITQRPARLSKDVLTQANCLIMHRLPAPQDRDAAKAWVDGNGDRDKSRVAFDTLAALPVGEAWVLAQEPPMLERARFPAIKTLDTSATPKAGEQRIEPKTLADVDLTAIREALAAAQEKAAPKKQAAAPDQAAIKEAEQRGYDRGFDEALARGVRALSDYWGHLLPLVSKLKVGIEELDATHMAVFDTIEGRAEDAPGFEGIPSARWDRITGKWADIKQRIGAEEIASKPSNGAALPAVRHTKEIGRKVVDRVLGSSFGGPGALESSARRMLDVLDTEPPRRLSWQQIAIATGYIESGGAFRRGRKALIDGGHVIETGGFVRAAKLTGGQVPWPAAADIVAAWREKLEAPGAAVLDRMAGSEDARDGHGIDVETIAAALDYQTSGGAWRRGIKALRDAGIVLQGKSSAGVWLSFTDDFRVVCGWRWRS